MAATGMVALMECIEYSEPDNIKAQYLADLIRESKYLIVRDQRIETNLVFWKVSTEYPLEFNPANLQNELMSRKLAIRITPLEGWMRLVLHKDITNSHIRVLVDTINNLLDAWVEREKDFRPRL